MEKEREILKLNSVLRRITRAAAYLAWSHSQPDAVAFCATQYNKVLARLGELEPAIVTLFTPVAETASADVIRLAARETLAYFEDETPKYAHHHHRRVRGCRPARVWVGWYPMGGRCW